MTMSSAGLAGIKLADILCEIEMLDETWKKRVDAGVEC
jgi:hypothetical protein